MLKEQRSSNLVWNMGHKGPVLRCRSTRPGRARIQILFYHFQFWIQKFSMLHFSCSVYCCKNYLRQQEIYRVKYTAVVTRTVIGISSFFCTIKRNLVLMVAFLNDICSHGCLVFHALPKLLARSAYLVSQLLHIRSC